MLCIIDVLIFASKVDSTHIEFCMLCDDTVFKESIWNQKESTIISFSNENQWCTITFMSKMK